MLTRSPVAPRSSNASPSSFHSFHYAPSPPSRSSVVPLARRQSKSSSASGSALASPSPLRQKQYVGVDAATQYSPIEPVTEPQPQATPNHPPPIPGPRPMALPLDEHPPMQRRPHPPPPPSIASSSKQPEQAGTASQSADSPQPNKRRNSQDAERDQDSAASTETGSSVLPKRPRPDAAPPKVLPRQYELCAIDDMVILIANMLGDLIQTNDPLALRSGHLTRFHSRTAPGISVRDYLQRLAKHATLTPPILLSMVYYIDRLCTLYPVFTINTLTVHRYLITAATVASKGLSDSFWNNSTYARVGGVRVAELKLLELEFLYRVDWKIVPNPDVLVAYYKGLVERTPGYVLEKAEPDAAEDAEEDDEDYEDIDEDDEMEESAGDAANKGKGPEQLS